MSEPVAHDVSTHPCAQCAGPRKVEEMDWRDPAYWVTCTSCGNTATGTSMEEAVEAWDEANPMRDVSPEEAQAVEATLLQARLTPATVSLMKEVIDIYSRSSQPQNFGAFLEWCDGIAATGR
jgi:hypothetical protein